MPSASSTRSSASTMRSGEPSTSYASWSGGFMPTSRLTNSIPAESEPPSSQTPDQDPKSRPASTAPSNARPAIPPSIACSPGCTNENPSCSWSSTDRRSRCTPTAPKTISVATSQSGKSQAAPGPMPAVGPATAASLFHKRQKSHHWHSSSSPQKPKRPGFYPGYASEG